MTSVTDLRQPTEHAPAEAATTAFDGLATLDHGTRRSTFSPGDAPPGRYLAVEDPDGERLLRLERGIIAIGRALTAELRLDDHTVSRRHSLLVIRSGGVRVLDDRSTNGTFVNGRRVSTADLADGDVLAVGRVVMTYVEVPERG